MKKAILLGSDSDIAKALIPYLKSDGWKIAGWSRKWRRSRVTFTHWDLAIVCLGRVAPVGLWHSVESREWDRAIKSNLLLPIHLLRENWVMHNPGASICFMAGSNPQMIMDGYSAYNAGKMALLKTCEQLDHETPDAKFFALGPGIVNTKIHQATIEAGWPNRKLEEALKHGISTPIDRIYKCLMWCVAQKKSVVGGRNVCVSDMWDQGWLEEKLEANPKMYKLRRVE